MFPPHSVVLELNGHVPAFWLQVRRCDWQEVTNGRGSCIRNENMLMYLKNRTKPAIAPNLCLEFESAVEDGSDSPNTAELNCNLHVPSSRSSLSFGETVSMSKSVSRGSQSSCIGSGIVMLTAGNPPSRGRLLAPDHPPRYHASLIVPMLRQQRTGPTSGAGNL